MIIFMLVSTLIGYIYEDSDSLIVYNDSLIISGYHHYNIKIHIANYGRLKVRPWDGTTDSTGWLSLNAPSILIQASSSINGSESGYQGGHTSGHPYGYGPGYGGSGTSGGGGGAGHGGVGGIGGDVTPGAGGDAYGEASDTLIDMGSGGGAGRLGFVDGPGGNGGAKICVRGQKITLDSSAIETDGQRGFDGALEAGGAGSGGGIMVWADTIVIHNATLNANGGNGGDAEFGGGGGAGGGRIKIFSSSSFDTSGMVLSVGEGAAGTGTYGDPEPGMPGSIYIGPVLGVMEIVQKPVMSFIVHSTLVKNSVKITIQNPPLFLKVYDISGRIAKSFWLKNKVEHISLRDLRQGIYFLRLDDECNFVGKIILLK